MFSRIKSTSSKLSAIFFIIILVLVVINFLSPKDQGNNTNNGINNTSSSSNNDSKSSSKNSSQLTKWKEISEKMNTKEKISQLFIVGINGTTLTDKDKLLLKQYPIGGVIFLSGNIKTQIQTKQLIEELNKSLPTKPFLAVDQEGGSVSRIPWDNSVKINANELTSDNITSIQKDHINSLKDLGFNLNLAPVVDVSIPKSLMLKRSISSYTKEVVDISKQILELNEEANLMSCIKHYPGIGSIIKDPHEEIATIEQNLSQIEQKDLVPFKELSNLSPFVMTTHVISNALDKDNIVTFSSLAIEKLRKSYKYNGIIITDDLNMNSVKGIPLSYEKSLYAGHTMILTLLDTSKLTSVIDRLSEEYDKEFEFRKLVDTNLEIILTTKERYSLL